MAYYFISDVPYSDVPYSGELYHHGILGQKWGIRRFQNPDGTLTPAGRERYGNHQNGHRNQSEIVKGAYRFFASGKHNNLPKDYRKALEEAMDVSKEESGLNSSGKIIDELLLKNPRDAENFERMIANPGSLTRLSKDLKKVLAENRAQAVVNDVLLSNISMDMINKMPSDMRDAAMAYVFDLANWG